MSLRHLRMGLSTILGLAPQGFFIPHRYAGQLTPAARQHPYDHAARLFAAHAGRFAATLSLIDGYADALEAIGGAPPPAPRWTQDWFPRLDGAVLYGLMRHHRPRRVVEVGSGHSTRFVVQAVRDGAFETSIVAIDPAPRASLATLPVRVIRTTVQDAGREPFAALEAGDFLVIDSSHVLMPGTDVDVLLNRILPALCGGVVIHFHDIFLPDPYPSEWDWRGYNEQQAVAALLCGGERFEPLFASRYVTRFMAERLAQSAVSSLPLPPGAFESSLWLRRRG